MKRTDVASPGHVRTSIALFVTTSAAMASYFAVFRGAQWWLMAVVVIGVVLTVVGVARGLRLPYLAIFVAGIIAWFESLLVLFAPDSAVLWVVPSPATFSEFGGLLREAIDRFVENEAPMSMTTPDVFTMAAIAGLVALAVDAICQAIRAPAVSAVLFFGVYLSPTVIAGRVPSILVFVAIALPWLYLLRADMHSRSAAEQSAWRHLSIPAVAIASASLIVGVGVPPALPATSNLGISWGDGPPGTFDTGINPILALGENLRRNQSVVALELTTEDIQAPYLKVTNLRDFTGATWRPGSETNTGWENKIVEGAEAISPQIDTELVKTSIMIKRLDTNLLPLPYPTETVDGLTGRWELQAAGRIRYAPGSESTRGQSYTATSVEVEPTLEQIRAADTDRSGPLINYTTLPPLPQIIQETAQQVTATATNDYDRMIALQSYFRGGQFSYSESAPVEEGFDGNGVQVIAEFLKVKSGYCVHFSSAMAVMARAIGIPARIAVGFAPGARTGETRGDKPVFEVTTDDLHAWPEIYFDGIGWVGFEPTPGRGSETAFASEAVGSDAIEDVPEQRAPVSQEDLAEDAVLADEQSAPNEPIRSPWVLAFVVLLAIGGVPALVRILRRARRLRAVRSSPAPASDVWRELVDSARDCGIAVGRADTPRSFADRLAQESSIDGDVLAALRHRVEVERYAVRGSPSVEADECVAALHVIRTQMRAAMRLPERLAATFWPRSLWGQLTYETPPADLLDAKA